MPGGWGEFSWGIGPWGYTDYGVYSLFKQIPRFYLDTDAAIAGQPFKNFLLSVAPLIRSSREFSDRFPLLVDAQEVRPELLVTLGDNVGAFATNDDADIIKRNEILHAYTWFTTKQLRNAYIAIARMNGLDALVEEVYEIGEDSGVFTTTPPTEFQFAPGVPPNSGTFPQDPIVALPGIPFTFSPTFFPLPGTDFVDTFSGAGVLPDPPWETVTTGGGTAVQNGAGQLVVTVPVAGDAAFVALRDRYDRRAKFDTIVELFTPPPLGQVDSDTAFALAVLQAPVGGTLGPKPKAAAILDRRVTVELDRPNGAIYIRAVTTAGDRFWDPTTQAWIVAKVSAAFLSPLQAPYRITLRSHSQWFKLIIERTFGGPGFSLATHTLPFFWHDIVNNGMPMKVVIGETSNTTGVIPGAGMSFDRFETAQTEDNDYGKLSCLQIQFFIPPPLSGAGTYFPPFGAPLDATALAVILANIRSKFQKVTPIHIRIKYPTIDLDDAPSPARFFQHFDVSDLVTEDPITAADLAANPNVDSAFTNADAHPMDFSPGAAFTKPPWVAGVGVADFYKQGQDGGWVEAIQVAP